MTLQKYYIIPTPPIKKRLQALQNVHKKSNHLCDCLSRIFSIRRCSSYRCHLRTTVKSCNSLLSHSLPPLQRCVFHSGNLWFPLDRTCSQYYNRLMLTVARYRHLKTLRLVHLNKQSVLIAVAVYYSDKRKRMYLSCFGFSSCQSFGTLRFIVIIQNVVTLPRR